MQRIRMAAMVLTLWLGAAACGGKDEKCLQGDYCPSKRGNWKSCCLENQCRFVAPDAKDFQCAGRQCATATMMLGLYCAVGPS